MNRVFILLAALLLCAAALPAPAAPATHTPGDALLPAQVDAIVIEAKRRARLEDLPGQPWDALDPALLARLLRMPEVGALEHRVKSVLIEQAGAWDVMPFDKPSDFQAMWTRWFPGEGFDRQITDADRHAPSPNGWYADKRWGREAGAAIALKNCLPHFAWYVRFEDPMVWAFDHPGVEDRAGVCVRGQREDSPGISLDRETKRGKASAAILGQKLGAWLLEHGCSGTGPDSCLPLLYFLDALDPLDPRLGPLVRRIEPEIAPGKLAPLPPLLLATERARQETPDATTGAALTVLRRDATRKLIFMALKLPIVQRQAGAWPAGEFERGMHTAFTLAQRVAHVGALQGRRSGDTQDGRRWSHPWGPHSSEAAWPAATQALWVQLGRQSAGFPGCDGPDLAIPDLPQSFWIGFIQVKLQRERTSCGLMSRDSAIGNQYVAAKGNKALLAPLSALRPGLGLVTESGDTVRDLLGRSCPAHAVPAAQDPWRVCAARIARVAREAKRERAEARRAALDDRTRLQQGGTCSEDMLDMLNVLAATEPARAEDDEAGAVGSACRQWPAQPALVLAAALYQASAAEQDTVVAAIIDPASARVVSARRVDSTHETGMETATVAIDAARYALAPGIVAFGVDVTNTYSPRLAEGGASQVRTLLVRDGATLRPVLEGLAMARWGTTSDGGQETVTLALTVDHSTSHGFAGLRVRVVSRIDGQPPRTVLEHVLHYDGKRYPTDALEKAMWMRK